MIVYDYGTPRSDYAQERILFIHDTMIASRVQAHGLPPADFPTSRAAPGPSTVGGLEYNASMGAPTQVLHPAIMTSDALGMAHLPPTFHPGAQQHTMQESWTMEPDISSSMITNPADIYQHPPQYFPVESPAPMTDNSGQHFEPTYDSFLGQGNLGTSNDFDFTSWSDQQGGS
jgi:hypothetical protein